MPDRSEQQPEVAERVWAAMRAFVERNAHPGELRERLGLGLGAGRVRALLLLEDGPLSLRQIAEAHRVDPPYATVIVDKLHSLGLVERTEDPADRRRKLVELTPAGREAARTAAEALGAPPPELAGMSMPDLVTLDLLLTHLVTPDRKERP